MADKPVKAKKTSQTVRERSQTGATKKVRRLKPSVPKPVSAASSGAKSALRPLKKPFQNKPMRFIGRILSKVLLINYFRSSWRELRQVTWPNRKETAKLTIAVFMFAIVFGAIIALVDLGLDKVFRKILLS